MQVLEDPERATERLSETRQETDLVSRRGLQQASRGDARVIDSRDCGLIGG